MATTKITNPELFDLGSLNTALKLPSGTTAQRPTSPSTGEWRYNTTTNLVEFWDGGAWTDLQSEDIPPTPSENFNVVLYDGNGSTNNITGVGFQPDWVWIKQRDTAVENHNLYDSTRGIRNYIVSNSSAGNVFGSAQRLNAFGADGFTVGSDNEINDSGSKYVAWCWKANGGTTSSNTDGTNITSSVQVNAKAGFSIVQFTTPGTFNGSNTVGHGLGSTPDAIFVKRTDGAEDWYVYHQAAGLNKASRLNSTINYSNATYLFGTVNSTVFNPNYTSATSLTNIAYCFKSIPGYSKFGSYTGNGTTLVVNTGFQPGWIMIKSTVGNDNWRMYDTTRGISAGGFLKADTTATESTADAPNFLILSNGFEITAGGTSVGNNANGNLYTYYAFAADATAAPALPDSFANKLWTGNDGTNAISGLGFQPSFVWIKRRSSSEDHALYDMLRGINQQLSSNTTAAQILNTAPNEGFSSFDTDGFTLGNNGGTNRAPNTYVGWSWKANPIPTINTDGTNQSVVSANQANGFSIVQGTASGGLNTVNSFGHGLGVKPDLIIIKSTSSVDNWYVYNSISGAGKSLYLNDSAAEFSTTNVWANTEPTASVFSIKDGQTVSVGATLIAYCFASISGFSKIGSYTGTGVARSISGLGFAPNWVLLKEIDGVDSWEIFDTSRGAGNVLYANGNNAEVTTASNQLSSFDSDGFSLGSATSVNESGKTYIYMAFKENPTPMPLAGNMSFLVVAGGGGGGNRHGGGAGAGGLRTSYGGSSGGGSSAESDITLAAGTYTITVGGGGAGVAYNTTAGVNGTNSVLSGTGMTTITSDGGGGGGISISPNIAGSGGGSGGGGGSTSTGGSATANQGKDGGQGTGQTAPDYGGGGGGGATLIGNNGSGSGGGNGGNGLAVEITGSSVAYAGGGGGSSFTNQSARGLGGTGGGGDGAGNLTTGQSGTANLGGGGGGTTYDGGFSGAGGAGVVILRLLTSEYSSSTTGSPTVTTDGDYTVLTYTGSGTYVHS